MPKKAQSYNNYLTIINNNVIYINDELYDKLEHRGEEWMNECWLSSRVENHTDEHALPSCTLLTLMNGMSNNECSQRLYHQQVFDIVTPLHRLCRVCILPE